jgi:hypothetical protein
VCVAPREDNSVVQLRKNTQNWRRMVFLSSAKRKEKRAREGGILTVQEEDAGLEEIRENIGVEKVEKEEDEDTRKSDVQETPSKKKEKKEKKEESDYVELIIMKKG